MSKEYMDPDEYFLLTVVREARDAIHILADIERGYGLNLHDPPDLFGDRLLETLLRLFQRGDIVAEEKRWERGRGFS